MTLSISTLLLLPLGVFATPTEHGIATTRAIETAPFTPGSEPYELCTSHTITSLDLGDNVGSWISCLELQQWANDNPGKWTINDPADPEYWTALDKWDDCALVVENGTPTYVGNKDVDKLIQYVFFRTGTHMGSVEAKGTLTCTGGVTLNWWLRGSDGL
ncbi:hypothetical protein UCREL1_4369 [Eutypa lata UCREL1]|uniref:Ecp2 effector protein-like domain-containing protein n=1 Tax=Eutypa lata (strain UCR-EL1) TaxID=1287681 RepID=M7SVT8_EUTLA|nr:hypothetical protein UCREL1_4369 [Eutypa lata UCREL1]